MVTVGAYLVSCILPLSIYLFLRSARREDEAYRKDCRKLLLNGLLLGFPVFGFSLLCSILFSLTGIGQRWPAAKAVFRAFVLMGFSEELMKYLLAKKTIRKNLSGVSFLDLMAYTTVSAIGFELMEGAVYLLTSNVPQILVRGVTCMHASFGMIMGWFLARGIKRNGKLSMVPAVIVSALIHGTYDFLLDPLVFETSWGGLALVLAVGCLVLNLCSFPLIKKARKNPYYTDPLF